MHLGDLSSQTSCNAFARAGVVIGRARPSAVPPFHTSWHPRPLADLLCCVFVLSAPSTMCLHGTCGCVCVLPGWQINVNVNVTSLQCYVCIGQGCLSALFVGSGSRVCPVRD